MVCNSTHTWTWTSMRPLSLQASSMEVKQEWIRNIRELIQERTVHLKGALKEPIHLPKTPSRQRSISKRSPIWSQLLLYLLSLPVYLCISYMIFLFLMVFLFVLYTSLFRETTEDADSQGDASSQPDTISIASRTSQNTVDSDKVKSKLSVFCPQSRDIFVAALEMIKLWAEISYLLSNKKIIFITVFKQSISIRS